MQWIAIKSIRYQCYLEFRGFRLTFLDRLARTILTKLTTLKLNSTTYQKLGILIRQMTWQSPELMALKKTQNKME